METLSDMGAAAATPGSSTSGRYLAGRAQESRALLHQFTMASGSATRFVLLSGEPGIGKTRLLEWLGDNAARERAMVLRGGTSLAEGMPPYLPLLEALGRYVRTVETATLAEQIGDGAANLAVILPEIAARLGPLPPAYPLPAEQVRLRLFESIASFLAAIARAGTLVLLLDDLQWADPSTLDLLCHIGRTQPAMRLLVAGAYREGEAEALQVALAELTRQRCLTVVRVGPLSAPEVHDLAEQWLRGQVDVQLSALLYRECDGNPFFAEELLQEWRDTDALVRSHTGWLLASAAPRALPPNIILAVRQRLHRLPAPTLELLQVASVIGRSFPAWLVAAVTGKDVDTVETGLSEAERAQIVAPDTVVTFRFRHDVIRECLYEEVSVTARRRLHRAIGLALEERNERESGVRLVDLAFHFGRSGDHERGIPYSLQAGDDALQHSAHEEALAHFDTALRLLEPDDRRTGDVLLRAAEAALLAGKEERAISWYQQAQEWLIERDPAASARAAHGRGLAHRRRDEVFEAHLALQGALTLARPHQGPQTVRILTDLATLLAVDLGRQHEGASRAVDALDLARQLGDERLETAASRATGNLLTRGNHLPAGMQALNQALVSATALDDPGEIAECCACLANAAYWTADIEGSRRYTILRREAAQRCQQPFELRHIHSWLAFLAASQGDVDQAEALLAQARSVVTRLSSAEPLGFLHQIDGFLAWERGDYQRAHGSFQAAVRTFREHTPGGLVWYLGLLGRAQLALGKQRAAEQTLQEIETLIAAQPAGTLPTAPALTCLMLMVLSMGDGARAETYYPYLRAFAGQLHWFLVDLALAGYEVAHGDRRAATMHLDDAESAARRAGLPRPLDEIRALRARIGAPHGDKHLPAGLSPREAEVLRLVVGGMSNREIAETLFLSQNTVAKHLTSIFNKTGSENRAGAAAFALREGIVD